MSDYETTKQQMLKDSEGNAEIKASIESNFTEEIYNKLQLLEQLGKQSQNG